MGGELADRRHVGVKSETQHFAAAAGRASFRVIAFVDEASQRAAEKLLKEFVKNRQTKRGCALPTKRSYIAACRVKVYLRLFVNMTKFSWYGAATLGAADFAGTDGCDPQLQRISQRISRGQLASAATAISYCGLGFSGPRLLSTAPQFSAVAAQCGVTMGWRHPVGKPHLEQGSSAEDFQESVADAARCESSLQMVAPRTGTFGVEITGTRRTMCVGFAMRVYFAFWALLPHFIIDKIDHMSPDALGHIMDKGGDESDSSSQAALGGGTHESKISWAHSFEWGTWTEYACAILINPAPLVAAPSLMR